jgi:hypothetical protein
MVLKLVLVLLGLFALLQVAIAATTASRKKQTKSDPNDVRGNTPFWLRDANDGTCFTAEGFSTCDEKALWMLTRRAGRKTYSLVSLLNYHPKSAYCLERKTSFLGLFGSNKLGYGVCNKDGAQSWEFEFVGQSNVRLSSRGQCIVRGKRTYKNSISTQSCKKGEFAPLKYVNSHVHDKGYLLKAADGTCFDGNRFRICDGTGQRTLYWGVGIKFLWGKSNRYMFNFSPTEQNYCLVGKGSGVSRGACKDSGALGWSLENGQLTKGKMCVARLPDNNAVMAKCSEAFEHITLEIPTSE